MFFIGSLIIKVRQNRPVSHVRQRTMSNPLFRNRFFLRKLLLQGKSRVFFDIKTAAQTIKKGVKTIVFTP